MVLAKIFGATAHCGGVKLISLAWQGAYVEPGALCN
jgi:hypothetical protein